MIFLIIDSFSRIINALPEMLSGGALSVANLARYLVGIGLLVKIVKTFLYSKPENPIEWQILIKPIIIVMVLAGYPQLMKGINLIFNEINEGTQSMVDRVGVGGRNPVVVINKKMETTETNPTSTTKASDIEQKGFDKISSQVPQQDVETVNINFMDWMAEGARDMVKTVLIEIFKPIAAVISDCYKMVAGIILALLFVGGPIAIGLSCLPGFEESLSNWIVAYVNISFWPFILNIIAYIFMQFTADNSISIISTSATQGYGILFFYMAIILSVFMVPTISKYFIASSGAGAALQKGGKMASAAIRAAVTKI